MLIFSCLSIPYRVAFVETSTGTWDYINIAVDVCFLIDIIIIFNTAYYDENYQLIDDRKLIAKKYIKSWFFVDVISILPIEYILKQSSGLQYNDMIRIVRIGRMYKLVKLTRLVRMLKFIK